MTLVMIGVCILFFQVVFCFGLLENLGELIENDPSIFIGHKLELVCNLKSSVKGNASDLYITRKNQQLIPEANTTIIGSHSIKFEMMVTDPEDGGSYYCKLQSGSGQSLIVGSQFVYVDYELVAVPENSVKCQVFDWDTMNCTWDLVQEYVNPNQIEVLLYWEIDWNKFRQKKCRLCPKQERESCYWSDGSADMSMLFYLLIIVKNKVMAVEKYTVVSIYANNLVKPSHVIDIQASSNSTCSKLTWSHKKSISRMIFEIVWKSQYTQKNLSVSRNELCLCHLISYTTYSISVRARPKEAGFWSDPQLYSVQTDKDIPTGAPQLTNGSYEEIRCLDKARENFRSVVIFWREIDPIHYCDKTVSYWLAYAPVESSNNGSKHLKNIKATKIDLCLEPGRVFRLTIWAYNSVGKSELSSTIYLKPKNTVPALPVKFIVLVSSVDGTNNLSVSMTWDDPDVTGASLTGYTIYRCHVSVRDKKCEHNFTWILVPATNRSFVTTIPNSLLEKTRFGISAESKEDSSGISWSYCNYQKNQVPNNPPEIILRENPSDRGFKVEWEPYSCSKDPVYVIKYVVFFCMVKASSGCEDSEQLQEVSGDTKDLTINDLEGGANYSVSIQAVTTGGSTPRSKQMFMVVVDNSQKKNIIVIIIGSIFGIILAPVGIIYLINKCYKAYLKCDTPLDIIIPEAKLCDENSQYSKIQDSSGLSLCSSVGLAASLVPDGTLYNGDLRSSHSNIGSDWLSKTTETTINCESSDVLQQISLKDGSIGESSPDEIHVRSQNPKEFLYTAQKCSPESRSSIDGDHYNSSLEYAQFCLKTIDDEKQSHSSNVVVEYLDKNTCANSENYLSTYFELGVKMQLEKNCSYPDYVSENVISETEIGVAEMTFEDSKYSSESRKNHFFRVGIENYEKSLENKVCGESSIYYEDNHENMDQNHENHHNAEDNVLEYTQVSQESLDKLISEKEISKSISDYSSKTKTQSLEYVFCDDITDSSI